MADLLAGIPGTRAHGLLLARHARLGSNPTWFYREASVRERHGVEDGLEARGLRLEPVESSGRPAFRLVTAPSPDAQEGPET